MNEALALDFSSLLDAIESADPFQSEILAQRVAALDSPDVHRATDPTVQTSFVDDNHAVYRATVRAAGEESAPLDRLTPVLATLVEELQGLVPEVATLVEQQNRFERLIASVVEEQEKLRRLMPDLVTLLAQQRELARLIEATVRK